MVFVCRSVFKSLCFMLLLGAFNAHASDVDYLKMLENEAAGVVIDQQGKVNKQQQAGSIITKPGWSWDGEIVGDVLPTGLAQDEFATVLKQHFFGTFVFYRRLNSVDQNTVFYHYTKAATGELEPIREDVLNLLRR